jgi:hypothetical protein
MTIVKEMPYLVGVREIKWEITVTEMAGEYTYFCGMWSESHELGTGFLVHQRIISAVMDINACWQP